MEKQQNIFSIFSFVAKKIGDYSMSLPGTLARIFRSSRSSESSRSYSYYIRNF